MKNRQLKLGLIVGLVTIIVLVVAALALNWSNKEEGSIPFEKNITTGNNSSLKVAFLTAGAIEDKDNMDIYSGIKKANKELGASVGL
ncbi:hypothetical protein AZF37_09150 [endosymbiont 'TC1' of Trimyema compressum]|uniref:hypothetical protein n=1 Tax=endosymbiont 'TC1' of Trimyema compressum TaxID=243899 RepID=UPI0007F065C9|nr:hypothetical protein [endosymbiont 'TC1' of Trimyema compressum]AMP21286.1 hypothetical protein AZF37_09150 [endosymbiont 'TC1' of Trimyema compressum]